MRARLTLSLALFLLCTAALWAEGEGRLAIAWGPILGDVTPTSVRIAWTTTVPARSRVLIDGAQVLSPQRTTQHEVLVSGLQPGRSYDYKVEAFAGERRAGTNTYRFLTPPLRLPWWSFVVFGDTRTRHDDHRRVVRAILRLPRKPWLALHTGDLVGDGRKKDDWDQFFDIEGPLLATVPFYPCAGNHEHESEYYYDTFPIPHGGGPHGKAWYSFTFGGAMFVVLNSQIDLRPQRRFLDEKLSEADQRGIKWRFLIWHEPPYSSGSHGGNEQVAKTWGPVIDQHPVTAVFCGHDHAYEHSVKNGVHYIVTGGGGAPRYPVGLKPNPYSVKAESTLHFLEVLVSPTEVTVRAIRPDGSLIEEFRVR